MNITKKQRKIFVWHVESLKLKQLRFGEIAILDEKRYNKI